MTFGHWKCVECGHEIDNVFISAFIDECPKCGVKYEFVKEIQPHIIHTVVVTKSKKSGKLNVVLPITFAIISPLTEDVKEYFTIVAEIKKCN